MTLVCSMSYSTESFVEESETVFRRRTFTFLFDLAALAI